MFDFSELKYLTDSEIESIKKFGYTTVKDICFNCCVSRQTVYKYINSCRLHAFKIASNKNYEVRNVRYYVICDSAYDDFVKSHSMF